MHILQSDIDKCIKKLNDHATKNMVLRAKKAVLKSVCHNYCCMTQNKLDSFCTKDELYAATTNWICA